MTQVYPEEGSRLPHDGMAYPLYSGVGSLRTGTARSVLEVVRDHFDQIRDQTGYSVPAGVADELSGLAKRLR